MSRIPTWALVAIYVGMIIAVVALLVVGLVTHPERWPYGLAAGAAAFVIGRLSRRSGR